jgi:hypothetical protein
MMSTIAELKARLETLTMMRASGAHSVRFEDYEVQYRSDKELLAAIAAVQDEIAALEGHARPRSVIIRSQKGW